MTILVSVYTLHMLPNFVYKNKDTKVIMTPVMATPTVMRSVRLTELQTPFLAASDSSSWSANTSTAGFKAPVEVSPLPVLVRADKRWV